MSKEGRHAIVTVVLAVLMSAVLIVVAWGSMAGLALVGITALVCLGVGWSLGYHYGVEQRKQAQRARRRQGTTRRRAPRKAK